jgi:nucleotide-binding universal stress UspA family protein
MYHARRAPRFRNATFAEEEMTYRSILVHIDGRPDSATRIDAAARLAAKMGAELVGLAIVPPLELPQALRSNAGAKAMLQAEWEKSRAAARSFATQFEGRAKAAGVKHIEAAVAEDEPVRALEKAARRCDLVVLGQPDRDDLGALGGHFVETAVLEVSRPVLVVPHKARIGALGERILVAWKDASASARALADARPMLEKASEVIVLGVGEDGEKSTEGEAVAYLARHGIQARGVSVEAGDAGEAIVEQSRKLGVDLVVMGAYARHRFTEMVLGGATRTVLQTMATPVLMSH